MSYLELDDIIYNLQRFGGATTYWEELSARIGQFVPGPVTHIQAGKFARLRSPKSSAKVFHSSHFRVSSSRNVKNVTTIHDLIYEKGMARGKGKILNLYERKKSVVQADAIICISESTRRDLYECYEGLIGDTPVHVIHHGCTRLPTRAAGEPTIFERPQLAHLALEKGRFFMFVGGRGGYKNFDLVLQAFVAGKFASQGVRLICTGSGFNEQEQALIGSLGLADTVVSIGFLDTAALGELYSVARALVYPSAYEGFGLPPLEAMTSGCPVICARSSSLPEVVGEAGVLVTPGATDQLVSGINIMLSDDARTRFITAGYEQAALFDWNKTAQKHAAVYESLAAF